MESVTSDVVVVGAGVAGLTAASNLAAAGLDVVVIEARDRIGGRSHTQSVGSGKADLGAAWVHDPVHNPLTTFLESTGIEIVSDGMWGHGMRAFTKNRWLSTGMTSTLVAALYNFDAAAARAGVNSDRYSDGIKWYLESQAHPATEFTFVEAFLGRIIGAGVTGDHASDISLDGMAAYEGEESGHNALVVGGYGQLVEHLAHSLNIQLSTPISRVDHSDSGAQVLGMGQTFAASWAVVTVPLGVLKGGGLQFAPDLPADQLRALSKLKAKSLEKVILTFDDRFWDDDVFQVALLDDANGFIWLHDLSRTSGVPTLAALYNPAIASAPMFGEVAVDGFRSLLGNMFGSVPEIRGVATTNWSRDPYSLGAYSFVPVGASIEDMRALTRPAGPRVLLAGEHTFPSYYGTVQAAWLSGQRAARTIIDREAGSNKARG